MLPVVPQVNCLSGGQGKGVAFVFFAKLINLFIPIPYWAVVFKIKLFVLVFWYLNREKSCCILKFPILSIKAPGPEFKGTKEAFGIGF